MDAASVGNKPFKGDPNFNDMKKILEGLEAVKTQEPTKEVLNEDVAVTMSGHTAPEVAELVSLMANAGVKADPAPMPAPMPAMKAPMPAMDKPMDKPMDKLKPMAAAMAKMDKEQAEEDYANSPDEKYAPYSDMTNPPTNDLNKSKKSYPAAAGGDNPMAIKARIKEQLEEFYKNYK